MSMTTGDQAMIKRINTAIVLEAILRHAPLSRAKISETTGLNKATVSSLVQDLIDNKLVAETGTGASSGGRKPVMLEFVADAGYAVGIDLGVNYMRGVLTDLRGNVVSERMTALTTVDPDRVFGTLRPFIQQLMDEAPDSPFGIVGIGVGVPGLVDRNGSVLFAPNMDWRDVPLREALSRTFNLPVMIDNEANAGALGEQRFGIGRGISNIVYVSVGIGIGTGLILQSRLYKGSSGFSGEIGHMTIEAGGKPCRCGNLGCWELYASEQALLEQAAELGYKDKDLDGLLAAAEAGDESVASLLKRIGEYLGIGIANIVNVFNPNAVIIAGRLSRARPWLEEAVKDTLERRALGFHLRNVNVLYAELGDRSAVMGAVEMAISLFFERLKTS